MNDRPIVDPAGGRGEFSAQQWRALLTEGHAPLVRARRVLPPVGVADVVDVDLQPGGPRDVVHPLVEHRRRMENMHLIL